MGTGTTIIISVAAIACAGVGAYCFLKKQKPQIPVNIDRVDTLSLEDVVGWFKSLNLDSSKHTPFICNNISLFNLKLTQELTPPYVLLGVYDENKNSLAPYRLLELKSIDSSLKEMLDKSPKGLVVLS